MSDQWWNRLKSVTLHDESEPTPRLWPNGASAEYIDARTALLDAEVDLRDHLERVAAMRRALPEGTVISDYVFRDASADREQGSRVRLSELFGGHDTLVIYHLMFHPEDDEACAMCSLWVDGFPGIVRHINARTAFAIVARAPVEKLTVWGERRGWNGLRLVSSADSTFSRDLGFEAANGGQWPSFAVFTRQGDRIRHQFSQCADLPNGERGNDLLSPVWNLFDLLPQGRGEWLPDNDYSSRANLQISGGSGREAPKLTRFI